MIFDQWSSNEETEEEVGIGKRKFIGPLLLHCFSRWLEGRNHMEATSILICSERINGTFWSTSLLSLSCHFFS